MTTANDEVKTGEVIPFNPDTAIAVFSPFQKQLTELKGLVESSHFDYEDPKQNQEARSLVHKVRKVKAAVEKARKDAKQASLDYGRALDSKAKDITVEIESIIEVHQKPLDAIEQREKDRKEKIEAKLQQLRNMAAMPTSTLGTIDSVQVQTWIDETQDFVVDASFDEFMAEATKLKEYALSELQSFYSRVKKQEDDAAELKRLQEEEAKRQQEEREERIRKEAAEKAEREAKEAREREQKRILEEQDNAFLKLEQFTEFANGDSVDGSDLAIRRDALRNHLSPKKDWPRFDEYQQLWNQTEILLAERYREVSKAEQEARNKADRERQEQAAKAERDRLEREQKEQQEREKQERQQREANLVHKSKIESLAVTDLVGHGIDMDLASQIVSLIAEGKVSNISIEY